MQRGKRGAIRGGAFAHTLNRTFLPLCPFCRYALLRPRCKAAHHGSPSATLTTVLVHRPALIRRHGAAQHQRRAGVAGMQQSGSNVRPPRRVRLPFTIAFDDVCRFRDARTCCCRCRQLLSFRHAPLPVRLSLPLTFCRRAAESRYYLLDHQCPSLQPRAFTRIAVRSCPVIVRRQTFDAAAPPLSPGGTARRDTLCHARPSNPFSCYAFDMIVIATVKSAYR